MDSLRTLLIFALALVSLLLWQAWQQDYPATPAASSNAVSTTGAPASAEVPQASVESTVAPVTETATLASRRVTATTNVLRVGLDSVGASLRRAELLRYPVSLSTPDEPFVVLNDSESLFYIVQGGLLSKTGGPTHYAPYREAAREYTLAEGAEVLEVPFVWEDAGLRVTKTYQLRRDSYLIGVRYRIENNTGTEWRGQSYAQIQRDDPGRSGRRLIYTYVGAVISAPDLRYEKIDFEDMPEQEQTRAIADGWVAMIQHYFVTALLPVDRQKVFEYYAKHYKNANPRRDEYLIGVKTPQISVPSGRTAEVEEQIYIGPKQQDVLAGLADGLELTVDYGALWFIAKPLFWCLQRLHEITGNWGWAIILVTVALKVLFYKLSAAGYRSMANMRRVQPRIIAIRDRYQNDKTRLNQAMMQIYKEEKINPFGGCLPIVVQIPVFIALYWVLLESVEMRQAPFVLWLLDLSAPDPYWVLPVIMGATMLVQQKLNPAPLDPVQEKVMMILPFAFTIFFGFFPAGLVLYWVVNNILSIAQQWLITRSIEQHPPKPGG